MTHIEAPGGGLSQGSAEALIAKGAPSLADQLWAPANSSETLSRRCGTLQDGGSAPSGWLVINGGCYIPASRTPTTISFVSGTTAGKAMTHQWFALYEVGTMNLLAVTEDDTNKAWAANTIKTLKITSAWTPKNENLPVYLGQVVTGETTPSGYGGVPNPGMIAGIPILSGISNKTGLTTPATAPNPAEAPKNEGTNFHDYAYVTYA